MATERRGGLSDSGRVSREREGGREGGSYVCMGLSEKIGRAHV